MVWILEAGWVKGEFRHDESLNVGANVQLEQVHPLERLGENVLIGNQSFCQAVHDGASAFLRDLHESPPTMYVSPVCVVQVMCWE